MEAAGVRLPARPSGLGSGLSLVGGRYPFLFTHDPLDALAEFFERFALGDELQHRTEQGHRGVHLVHFLTSFLKGLAAPALQSLYYTNSCRLSIPILHFFVDFEKNF